MELEREETKSVENVAQIKHRERNYMGMLEYRKEDEGAVMKALILGRLKQPYGSTHIDMYIDTKYSIWARLSYE